MKQCKLCGIPLGNEPKAHDLENHWRKHHGWHWEKNKEMSAENAILKKR